MEFLATVITCDGREAALKRTLESVAASDWGAAPLVVHDTHRMEDRKVSQVRTAHQALKAAAGRAWDYLLFLEDDVEVNRNIRWNLERWSPVKWGTLLVGSLYQSGRHVPVTADYGLAPCRTIGGSQGVVIARRWLPCLLNHWTGLAGEGMQDLRMYRSVEKVFPFIPVHTPHLVQHQPGPSTWGGGGHTSAGYDSGWKAG